MDELIRNVFSKYDDSNKNYSKLILHPNKIYNIDTSNLPLTDGTIVFEGDTTNETFSLNSYFIGAYHVDSKVWIWNWCHPLPSKNIQLGNILINYALNFDEEKLKREDFSFLRSILVNSRIKIENDYNMDILFGLILHITNVKVLIPIDFQINDKKVIYYYGIKDPSNKKYYD